MKRISSSVTITILILSMHIPHGYGGGFPSLKLGFCARSEGLGLAYIGFAEGASSMYWNPAGLAQLNGGDILFSHHRWIQDVRGLGLAFGWGQGNSGTGVHILYTDIGEMEFRTVPSPVPETTFSANELIAGVSHARTILDRLRVGVTVKLFYEKIFIEEAWGYGVDVGVLWEAWEDGLRIGGVVQNIGKTNDFRNEAIELPLTARIGLAYGLEALGGQFLFVLDGVQEKDFPFHLHGGVEFGWRGMLFIRGGYQTGYETRDVTAGAGIIWNRFRLDYSCMPLGAGLGDSHRLTIGIGW